MGSPKTGTTFLQNVLWSQRQRAAEQGLLLPLNVFADHFLATLDLRGLSARPEHPPRAVGIWDRLVEEARAWPGRAVLVSHELFAAANAEQAARAVAAFGEDAEVHVVLTARDLVRQIPAEWQEHVKHRSTKTLPDFVRDLRQDTERRSWFWQVQDFADVVERWGASLPPSQVHVVTVPQSGQPETLWVRFASTLGLDPADFDIDVSRSNTSLGREQAELLRRVNVELGDRLPIPGPYPRVVTNILAHRILAGRGGTRLALDESTTEFAVKRSREIAGRLSDLRVDVVGDLEELVPALPPASTPSPSTDIAPSDEVLLAESIAALAGVLEVLGDRRAQQHYEEKLRQLRDAPSALRADSRERTTAAATEGATAVSAQNRTHSPVHETPPPLTGSPTGARSPGRLRDESHCVAGRGRRATPVPPDPSPTFTKQTPPHAPRTTVTLWGALASPPTCVLGTLHGRRGNWRSKQS